MDIDFKNRFSDLWIKYFPGVEFSIGFFFTDQYEGIEKSKKLEKARCCIIGDLMRVRKGKSLVFGKESIGCEVYGVPPSAKCEF